MRTPRRLVTRGIAAGGALGLGLTLAACASDDNGNGTDDPPVDPGDPACEQYEDYLGHEGESVGIYTPIVEADADSLEASWREFEGCTGITIAYEGTTEFEAQIRVRVQGGNPPDIAFVPQPGLLDELVAEGSVLPAPPEVAAIAEQNWPESWLSYTTVDGTLYGAPLGSNVKSYVWYSPSYFDENGYSIPQTWDELIALSDEIAATGIKPWCAGIASGDATGWPATDWVEDVILRAHGVEVYDQWWRHEIPFNDPRIAEAFDIVGGILKNDDYVNGGFNGSASIASTAFEDGGLPILDGDCAMHRQASFYANNFPEGTAVAEDGDVYAFFLPPIDATGGEQPVLAAGEFVIAYSDAPAVVAVQSYLATEQWANSRAALGNWVTGNLNADISIFESPIDVFSIELMRDPNSVLAFDGSDAMPGAVGAGSFWSEITEWIVGQDTQTTVDNIESSWP